MRNDRPRRDANANIISMPVAPRHMTISEVEEVADASFTHTPIRENMKLAKSIHKDCMPEFPAQSDSAVYVTEQS